jgi:hypothetical protein
MDDDVKLEMDLTKIDSVVLRRLIKEVRQEKEKPSTQVYNRVYTRHNRS